MNKPVGRLLGGAAAGVFATAAMSLAMLVAKRLGALGEPPPRRIVRKLLSPFTTNRNALDSVTLAGHFAFGGAAGCSFSMLPARWRRPSAGTLFGALVWAVSYVGVLPRLGLMPRPRYDRPGRPASMLAAHLVYGAALGAISRWMARDTSSLRGKVVVVCGGSRGLGRALARALLDEGAKVAICGRSPKSLEQTRAWLETASGTVLVDVCDLRREAQTRIFLDRVTRELGPIDVLIANAATIDVAPIEALEPADFHAAMQEIFATALNATLTVLPQMQARRRGTLVLISSVGGKLGVPHLAPYTAAKFAQVGFAEALRAEVSKDGVEVLSVMPGLMRTGSHLHASFGGNPERELIWFGASAVAPLLSINADRAARHVLRAIARGDRYLTFTPAARLGIWLHDRAPELWSALFAIAGRLLPSADGRRDRLAGEAILANSASRLVDLIRKRTVPLAERHGQ
ncbi:MAG TPA: SDR family NAD(P)-dependent oxidoreductase [Polyangiaceae bacterium]